MVLHQDDADGMVFLHFATRDDVAFATSVLTSLFASFYVADLS